MEEKQWGSVGEISRFRAVSWVNSDTSLTYSHMDKEPNTYYE